MRIKWTVELEDKLISLINTQEYTTKEISNILEIPYEKVRKKIQRMHLTNPVRGNVKQSIISEVIKLKKLGMTYQDISQVLNIKPHTAFSIIKKYSNELMTYSKRLSEEDIEYVLCNYNGNNTAELSVALKCSPNQILKILHKHNVSVGYSYTIDETFFDDINTSEKAYVLGLLFADGNNLDQKRVSIGLIKSDIDILIKVAGIMQYDYPIKVSDNKTKGVACLNIYNKNIISSLNSLGLIPRKSLIIKYPEIPDQFDKDFIRGYFDGNGSIVNGRFNVNICGSDSIIQTISSIVLSHLSVISRVSKMGKISRLDLTRKNSLVFLRWIYSDADTFLKRKHSLYIQAEEYESYLKSNNNVKYWTKEEEKLLMYYRSQKIPWVEIARKLSRTVSSVTTKYYKYLKPKLQ